MMEIWSVRKKKPEKQKKLKIEGEVPTNSSFFLGVLKGVILFDIEKWFLGDADKIKYTTKERENGIVVEHTHIILLNKSCVLNGQSLEEKDEDLDEDEDEEVRWIERKGVGKYTERGGVDEIVDAILRFSLLRISN